MKCTNKRRRRRRRRTSIPVMSVLIFVAAIICVGFILSGDKLYAVRYEKAHYAEDLFQGQMMASDLCVIDADTELSGFHKDDSLSAAGLFDVDHQQVLQAYHLFEELYPASTTKLMTALVVLKYGNLDDIVTVSENATNFNWDEQVCGLQTGDTISMEDLLNGLILYSGNDTAVAIAEHISGSVEAFVALMNEEAEKIGASNTNFVNPHGLHDENHKTTAYDLYLIFNECCKDERFIEIISRSAYVGNITGIDGEERSETWDATNYYSAKLVPEPEGIDVVGGKTGTTDEAGSCVVLYNISESGEPYISIIMGAEDKTILYEDMSELLSSGISDVKTE